MKQSLQPMLIKNFSEAEGTFEGYCSVFNVVDQGKDMVMPGAFTKSLKAKGAKGVKLLRAHIHDKPIGVWTEMYEDNVGLYGKGRLSNIPLAHETRELMKDGALDGLSIGYRTIRDEYDQKQGITMLHELDLWEVSVVTFAMNQEAHILAETVKSTSLAKRDVEKILRDAGLPAQFAKGIVNFGYDKANTAGKAQRDVGSDAGDKELLEIIRKATTKMEKANGTS